MRAIPPREPAVRILYRHFDASGVLLYVGSTEDGYRAMRQRHVTHLAQARWWPFVARVTYEPVAPGLAGFRAESAAIRAEGPIFNRTKRSVERAQRETGYLLAHPEPVVKPAASRRVERTAQIDAALRAVGVPLTGWVRDANQLPAAAQDPETS